jgi:hypothetical protein
MGHARRKRDLRAANDVCRLRSDAATRPATAEAAAPSRRANESSTGAGTGIAGAAADATARAESTPGATTDDNPGATIDDDPGATTDCAARSGADTAAVTTANCAARANTHGSADGYVEDSSRAAPHVSTADSATARCRPGRRGSGEAVDRTIAADAAGRRIDAARRRHPDDR